MTAFGLLLFSVSSHQTTLSSFRLSPLGNLPLDQVVVGGAGVSNGRRTLPDNDDDDVKDNNTSQV